MDNVCAVTSFQARLLLITRVEAQVTRSPNDMDRTSEDADRRYTAVNGDCWTYTIPMVYNYIFRRIR